MRLAAIYTLAGDMLIAETEREVSQAGNGVKVA